MHGLGFTFRLWVVFFAGRDRGPGNDLKPAIRMFRDGGAAFHPVAAIDVSNAEVVADGGVMNMAANHAVGTASFRFERQRPLEFTNIVDRIFDLVFCPLGE